MGRKWYEKAYTGTGKGLENLYGGIFGKQTTTGAEYPAGESFQRIMPLIGQVESEAGGIRERLFPEYARQLAEARSLRSNIPRMREKLLPELYRGLEGARAGLPNEEELFGMTKEEYQAALQRAKMEVPSEERLFGVMERRLRESLLPQLAASGLATSQGADVLAPRVSELATTFGERAFERELARQANIRQALEDITGFGERAFGRGIGRCRRRRCGREEQSNCARPRQKRASAGQPCRMSAARWPCCGVWDNHSPRDTRIPAPH